MNMEAGKEKIRRIKEEEEQAIREALGLAPKRATRPQGTWLNKHEFLELVKRGSWSWFLKVSTDFTSIESSLKIFEVLIGYFISPLVLYVHYFSSPFSSFSYT